jgi:hypothetical protein
MSTTLRDDENTEMLSLKVMVPRHLPVGFTESLEEGVLKAVEILTSSTLFRDLTASTDTVARLIVS